MKAKKANRRLKKALKITNQLLRLSKKERRNPAVVLDAFFSNYHLNNVREMFQVWLEAGLTYDNGLYQKGGERSDLIFFHRNLELLVEAAFVLKEQLRSHKQKRH